MRNKPQDADSFDWAEFEDSLDKMGVGEQDEDWIDLWMLWKMTTAGTR